LFARSLESITCNDCSIHSTQTFQYKKSAFSNAIEITGVQSIGDTYYGGLPDLVADFALDRVLQTLNQRTGRPEGTIDLFSGIDLTGYGPNGGTLFRVIPDSVDPRSFWDTVLEAAAGQGISVKILGIEQSSFFVSLSEPIKDDKDKD
jgi:hypothetical protein